MNIDGQYCSIDSSFHLHIYSIDSSAGISGGGGGGGGDDDEEDDNHPNGGFLHCQLSMTEG